MSVKLPVVIPENLALRTRATVAREPVPMGPPFRGLERRANQDRQQANQAFLDAITGISDSPETDLSTRVDEILYGGK
ncbi:MAG: hypothetical protein NTZ56_06200 [Acidobacteria bacterium]|nr:hypothetical protein [Acidobacteriota bacterium]